MTTSKLRACPTCGTPRADTKSLGLRDYSWMNEYLPGAEGASDGDFMYEKGGEILVLEVKPADKSLGLGQLIMLKALVRKGIHVWFVQEGKNKDQYGRPTRVKVGAVERWSGPTFMEGMSLVDLRDKILDWRKAAEQGRL